MAVKDLDITIFGATGAKGKCIMADFLLHDHSRKLSWAIAGHNEGKLREVRDWISRKTGQDVSEEHMVIADRDTLDNMAGRTRLVINCCLPQSHYRNLVVEACNRNDARHVDIREEPNVILLSKLTSAAKEMVNKKKRQEFKQCICRFLSCLVVAVLLVALVASSFGSVFRTPATQKPLTNETIPLPENRTHWFWTYTYFLNLTRSLTCKHISPQPKNETSDLAPTTEVNTFFLNLTRSPTCKPISPQPKNETSDLAPTTEVNISVTQKPLTCKPISPQPKNETSDLAPTTEVNISVTQKPPTCKPIPPQKNHWFLMSTGFPNLIRSFVSPTVYLLLTDRKSERSSSCLAEIITTIADETLPDYEKWLFLNGSELSSKSKSRDSDDELVENMELDMHSSRVVVVSDVDEIPGHLASAFHFLFDQEIPEIKDAVYVFTMKIDDFGGRFIPLDEVKKSLFNSWSDLSEDILYPLVTRITGAFLYMEQEEGWRMPT